ncbi:MAG: c-type cytochrome [Burkholderiaceae bacterium]
MNKTDWRFLAFGAAVVLASSFGVAEVQAQSLDPAACCDDRWDPVRSERGRWTKGSMGPEQSQRMHRHWTFMHQGTPPEYQTALNPVIATSANLKAGAVLYQENCAQCHGVDGMGDGEVGKALSPSPALVAYLVQRPSAVDGYLLWSIAEGGVPFETAMPAFKESMTPGELWRIILYMRAGLPQFEN